MEVETSSLHATGEIKCSIDNSILPINSWVLAIAEVEYKEGYC